MKWWEWPIGIAIMGLFFMSGLTTVAALVGVWPLWWLLLSVPLLVIGGLMWYGGVVGEEPSE